MPRRRACSGRRDRPDPVFTDTLELDLGDRRALDGRAEAPAGPRRRSTHAAPSFAKVMPSEFKKGDEPGIALSRSTGANFDLGHGDVVIAAITSCTNTSNPSVMIGAGLLARNAVKTGLTVKPWVKTSLAPGSQVVTEYLKSSGLQKDLDKLGFDLVGYGCTTCIGNSGPLPEAISETDPQERSRRRRRALRQSQFRRPRQSRCARQLSGLAAARRRLCAGGLAQRRSDATIRLGTGKDGKPVYLKRHLAGRQGDRRHRAQAT